MTKKEELEQDPIRIVFEAENQQSVAYDGDKPIGECQYNVDRTGRWVIMHTGVRPEYNGRGIAKRLVEKVIEAARDKQTKILPVCSYAQRMMSGKDEYRAVREQIERDEELTAVVRSRQLHIYRNGKKILILAGKAAPKIMQEDPLNALL